MVSSRIVCLRVDDQSHVAMILLIPIGRIPVSGSWRMLFGPMALEIGSPSGVDTFLYVVQHLHETAW